MRKKSVYIRKYHVNNTIDEICDDNQIQLKYSDKEKIKILDEINKAIPKLNQERKRTISIKYILKQIFDMLKIDCKNIAITKSVKALQFYDDYWNDLKKLINCKLLVIFLK